ncbi:MAG: AbrB/MazE/SpoVT family DNA-binding domain-containing protein [Patescibacteria group bacterium]
MQIQTVFRAGNSNVVAIPKDLSRELGIKPGQKVVIEKTEGEELVIRKARDRSKKISADEEFRRWWKAFLKDNAGILDELAVR